MMLKLALKLNTVEVHQVTPGGRKMELNGVEVDREQNSFELKEFY
jgi:hypothetical protein